MSLASITRQRPTFEELAELIRLAWPVVLNRVGIMVMGLTDAIVVGHYSARELGYHGLGWAPHAIVVTTGVGLLLGVQVMTARAVGEGRPDHAGAALRRGLAYAVGLGIASSAALVLAGPAFLASPAVGLEPDLARGAGRALQVFALSLPFYLIAVALTFFLEALARPKAGMVAMWLANGVNLLLNLWLVPGTSGLPLEGAVGSAWATFGARAALCVLLAVWVLRLPEARSMGVFRRGAADPTAAAEQRRIGYGAGASNFIEVGAFAGATLVAGRLGVIEVAAWNVVLNVSAIVFMAPLGLASATAVLVGRAVGAEDAAGVRRAGVTGFAVTAAVTALIALVVWPGARLISGFYSADAALLALVAPALALCALFFIADGLQVVAAQALRARGDVWIPTGLHLLSYAVVMLPLSWVFALPFGLGVNGIVWAVIVASLVSAGLLLGRWVALGRGPSPLTKR